MLAGALTNANEPALRVAVALVAGGTGAINSASATAASTARGARSLLPCLVFVVIGPNSSPEWGSRFTRCLSATCPKPSRKESRRSAPPDRSAVDVDHHVLDD